MKNLLLWLVLGACPVTGLAEEGVRSSAPEAELRVELEVDRSVGGLEEKSSAILLVMSPENETPQRYEMAVPGQQTLSLPVGSHWKLQIQGDQFWSRTYDVTMEPDTSELSMDVFIAGSLRGRIVSSQPHQLPEEMSIQISSSDERDLTFPEVTESCAIDGAEFYCQLPAIPLNLKLLADGFVPQYLWDIEVPREKALGVGTWKLRRGASVVGWVAAERDDFFFEQVDVTLRPLVEGTTAPAARKRLEQVSSSTRVDQHGFFQLSGVAAGRYALVLKHPEFAATRIDITAVDSEELEMAPIELLPAASLSLQIDYPTDPYRKPWAVTMSRRSLESGRFEKVVDTQADPSGLLEDEGLNPGDYLLSLFDSRGNRWLVEGFELFPGTNAESVTLQIRRLEGEVLLDDEPLIGASVVIREHEGNSRSSFRTRDDGIFYAFLRGDAMWNIEVTHEALDVAAFFDRVSIPAKRSDGRYARETFEIPDTLVFGEVVDQRGAPVEAPLMLDVADSQGRTFVQKPIPHIGAFELRGLPAEPTRLSARIDRSASPREAESRPVQVALTEGVDQGPIRLVIEDKTPLAGLVVAPSGDGVPGARVVALPRLTGQTGFVDLLTGTTDADGVFDLAVPAGVSSLELTVLPPGFAIEQTEVFLSGDSTEPVIVPVDSYGGTLVIAYPEVPVAWQTSVIQLTNRTKVRSTFPIPSIFLSSWSINQGAGGVGPGDFSRWQLPMMPTGPIEVCFGVVGDDPAQSCVEGDLAPGGELSLELPAAALQREFESARAASERR